jgi:hypothetical protein
MASYSGSSSTLATGTEVSSSTPISFSRSGGMISGTRFSTTPLPATSRAPSATASAICFT